MTGRGQSVSTFLHPPPICAHSNPHLRRHGAPRGDRGGVEVLKLTNQVTGWGRDSSPLTLSWLLLAGSRKIPTLARGDGIASFGRGEKGTAYSHTSGPRDKTWRGDRCGARRGKRGEEVNTGYGVSGLIPTRGTCLIISTS